MVWARPLRKRRPIPGRQFGGWSANGRARHRASRVTARSVLERNALGFVNTYRQVMAGGPTETVIFASAPSGRRARPTSSSATTSSSRHSNSQRPESPTSPTAARCSSTCGAKAGNARDRSAGEPLDRRPAAARRRRRGAGVPCRAPVVAWSTSGCARRVGAVQPLVDRLPVLPAQGAVRRAATRTRVGRARAVRQRHRVAVARGSRAV